MKRVFAVVAFAGSALVIAFGCSDSSDTTTGGDAGDDAPVSRPVTGIEGGAGDPDLACRDLPTCRTCCGNNHAHGIETYNTVFDSCICGADGGGDAGACGTVCGQSCIDDKTTPSGDCDECITTALGTDGGCGEFVSKSCGQDPDCLFLYACLKNCP